MAKLDSTRLTSPCKRKEDKMGLEFEGGRMVDRGGTRRSRIRTGAEEQTEGERTDDWKWRCAHHPTSPSYLSFNPVCAPSTVSFFRFRFSYSFLGFCQSQHVPARSARLTRKWDQKLGSSAHWLRRAMRCDRMGCALGRRRTWTSGRRMAGWSIERRATCPPTINQNVEK
jgi:hypothetical protein